MRVVIAGGGNVGGYIAGQLAEGGHDVLVIDIDRSLVERAQSRGEPAGVTWVAADACEVTALAEAHPETADVVVAATGDDEDNLVVALLCKQEFGVPRVVARVNHPENEWLFDERWGVDVSVSTPQLLTALVQEAVSVGSLVRLLTFERGRAGLVEVTLGESSPAADHEVQELGFPRDSTVVAVLRQDHVVVPRGDTVLRTGDEVLVLVTPEVEDDVRDLLVGERGKTSRAASAVDDGGQGKSV